MKVTKELNLKNNKEKTRNVWAGPVSAQRGITLIALIITIIVMLILVVVTIRISTKGGLFDYAGRAARETVISQEKEQVEMAYLSAIINNLGNDVLAGELQEELNKIHGEALTKVTINANGTLNVLFNDTEHNFNVNNGEVEKVEVDNSTMAMFDTGTNVAQKMYALAEQGRIQYWYIINNLSIDGIKRYTGTPDLSSMTDANIVSWTDAYTAYEQNPSAYSSIIPEGTRLCPIYMWFEESGTEEIRSILGDTNLTEITDSDKQKKVKTGTIYWWCESNNVYLNPDSSNMFLGLSYLSDISGLQSLKTDYTTNMSQIMCVTSQNQKLKNFDALSGWNISNVTDLSYALCGYGNLENIKGLKYWDTSKVENMQSIFGDLDCIPTKINDITALSNWDVSNVTNMSNMFLGCDASDLSALSNWDVGRVTNMSNMFYGCDISDLSALSNWDVSNVTNMYGMFSYCDKLVDASGINDWNIINVRHFDSMFSYCSVHPEFTKVTGTWDGNGTFRPTT